MTGAELITAERKRQIEEEGWTEEHDKEHQAGDLASAGAAYAADIASSVLQFRGCDLPVYNTLPNLAYKLWPVSWDKAWFKPTPNNPIRQLVKAGALIAAEIDKLRSEQGMS